MADKITSITFNDGKEDNGELFKLINQLAELRPAHSPTALVREVLLDTLPLKIAELKAKKK